MSRMLADAVKAANRGIIGLAPGPWDESDWPSEGYDGQLYAFNFDAADERPDDPFARSGYTREEWLTLADEMIQRWTDWKAHIAGLSSTEQRA